MIAAVERFGPYIVLADNFALPHAQSVGNVNRLAMSLLLTDQPTDMKGRPVSIFLVLAPTDNDSHLQALREVANLLGKPENLAIFAKGNIAEILALLNKSEES